MNPKKQLSVPKGNLRGVRRRLNEIGGNLPSVAKAAKGE